MKLGYVIIYVENVPETVAFYQRAFDLQVRFVHESNLYAEMETGQTALAFSAIDDVATNGIATNPNRLDQLPGAFEICLVDKDVQGVFDRAVQHGCVPLLTPTEKPWGQIVAYVRDLNGCLVELASPVG